MNGKQWILPVIGVILLGVFLILPPAAPLTSIGMKSIGILLFTIIWWAVVGTGYPSFIAIILIAITGVMTVKDTFAVSLGNWIVLFVMGSFGITCSLRSTGFSRRFALWFISRPFVAGHPWRFVGMFLLACTILGAVMSGTATTIVFLAVAEPLLEAMGYKRGEDFAATVMMGVAWAATCALGMTPIGHAGNIMAIDWIRRDFAYNVSFVRYMVFGVPMGLVTLGLLLLFYRFVVRPDVSKIRAMSGDFIANELRKMGPMKIEEKTALGVFLVVVALWMFPSTLGFLAPEVGKYIDKLGFAIPAMAGACLLCIIQIKGKPLLTLKQWMIDGVEWDTLVLVAAIGIVSAIIENPKTGIAEFLSQALRPLATALPTYGFIAFAMLWVTVQTNLMSNLASFTMVYTIMIPVAVSLNLGSGPALAVTISMASNYAFSLPSATTATAIVTGSRWVPVPFMAKYGIPLVIPVTLFFTFIAYPYAMLLFR